MTRKLEMVASPFPMGITISLTSFPLSSSPLIFRRATLPFSICLTNWVYVSVHSRSLFELNRRYAMNMMMSTMTQSAIDRDVRWGPGNGLEGGHFFGICCSLRDLFLF